MIIVKHIMAIVQTAIRKNPQQPTDIKINLFPMIISSIKKTNFVFSKRFICFLMRNKVDIGWWNRSVQWRVTTKA